MIHEEYLLDYLRYNVTEGMDKGWGPQGGIGVVHRDKDAVSSYYYSRK